MNQDESVKVINLLEVAKRLWRRGILLLLTAIIGGLVMYNVTIRFMPPEYESVSEIMIIKTPNRDEQNNIIDQNLDVSEQTITNALHITKGTTVLGSVIADMKLVDEEGRLLDVSELQDKIDVTRTEGSQIISIRVVHEDPYSACDIANKVRQWATNRITTVIEGVTVETLETAIVSAQPTASRHLIYNIFGVLGGFAFACLCVILNYILEILIPDQEKSTLLKKWFYTTNKIIEIAVLCVMLVVCGALFFQAYNVNKQADVIGPVITADNLDLIYDKKLSNKELLENVKAEDNVDGNCTRSLRVNRVLMDNDKKHCTVEYVARDKSHNVSILQIRLSCKE